MDQDRNLLFGVFAVQLRKVSPAQLIDAAAAWAADPARDLPSRLVDSGFLKQSDSDLIARLVAEAVNAHGGDVSATLAAFGGVEQVHRTFCGSVRFLSTGEVSVVPPPQPLGEETDPSRVSAVPETPGRYMHVSEYGRGGMGRVLLVHDQHLGRDIALKELLLDGSVKGEESKATPMRLSMAIIARFLQEARITGQLEHPAIVPVYELGHRIDGTLYYTMKLVRGKTLAQAIKEAGSLRARLALLPHFVDLCQAMAYAHSRNVIHRDLKPQNIMVGEFGETVVLDWGLAKIHGKQDAYADELAETIRAMNLGDEVKRAQTAYGQAMGTPAYMPPEQARGQLAEINERSDVYSLGAVLYELLTGHTPFGGSSLASVLRKVLDEEPAPVESLEKEAPVELLAICRRAMQKDPRERYASAREVLEEVHRFQTGALVHAHEYGLREYLGRFIKRNRTAIVALCAAILVVGAISGFYYRQIQQERWEAAAALAQEKQEATARQEEEKRRLVQQVEALQIDLLQKAEQADLALGRLENQYRQVPNLDPCRIRIFVPFFRFDTPEAMSPFVATLREEVRQNFVSGLMLLGRFQVTLDKASADYIAEGRADVTAEKFNIVLSLRDRRSGNVIKTAYLVSVPLLTEMNLARVFSDQAAGVLAKTLVRYTADALPLLQGKVVSIEQDRIEVNVGEADGINTQTQFVAYYEDDPFRDEQGKVLLPGLTADVVRLSAETVEEHRTFLSVAEQLDSEGRQLTVGMSVVSR